MFEIAVYIIYYSIVRSVIIVSNVEAEQDNIDKSQKHNVQ